ncbi:MAG TPA: hypothetical protein VJ647_01750 [Chitinophagaceae bacterium]|nr:hypothetical protein [Chitinophagaceae bacterium]
MFRQIIATILLLAFVFQTFYRTVIIMDYYTNTAAYAKNCENKARPKLHCNGKCQMMKKIKEEEKKEKEDAERRVVKNEVISSRSFFASILYIEVKEDRTYILHDTGSPVDIAVSFFHPPSLG